MNKKSMQVSLLTLIILIVTFIFILILVQQINDYLKQANAREYCRLSIVSMEASMVKGKQTLFNLDCPMQYINIKDSNLPKEDSKKQDAVIRKVADAMYSCWYQDGQGKYTNLESEFVGTPDAVCLLCSRISFDMQNEISIPLATVDDWFKKNSPVGSSVKYSEYLTFNSQPRYFYAKDQKEVSTKDNYYIVLWTRRPYTAVENVISLGLNIAIGNEGYAYVAAVAEKDFKSMSCDKLAN